MLARVLTCAVVGLDGQLVEVEVDIASYGMANFLNFAAALFALAEVQDSNAGAPRRVVPPQPWSAGSHDPTGRCP